MTKLEQLKAARDAAWAAEATAYATARGTADADAEATWAAYVVAYAESDAAVTAWVAELKKSKEQPNAKSLHNRPTTGRNHHSSNLAATPLGPRSLLMKTQENSND